MQGLVQSCNAWTSSNPGLLVALLYGCLAWSVVDSAMGAEGSAEGSEEVPRYEFKEGPVANWLLLGPVNKDERPDDPVQFFDAPGAGKAVALGSGTPLEWTLWSANLPDGMVRFNEFLKQRGAKDVSEDSFNYVYCTVRYDKPVELQLTVGTSGRTRIWVDDEMVIDSPYRDAYSSQRHRFIVDFTKQREHRLLMEIGRGRPANQFQCVGGFAIRGRSQYADQATPAAMQRITLYVNRQPFQSVTSDRSGRFEIFGVPYDAHLLLGANGIRMPIDGSGSSDMLVSPEIGQYLPVHLRFIPSDAAGIGFSRLKLPYGSFTGIAERPNGQILLFDETIGSVLAWNGTQTHPHPASELARFTNGKRGHLVLDSKQSLWIVTDQDGVYRFDGTEREHWSALQTGNRFASYVLDADDALWVSFEDRPGSIFHLVPGEPNPVRQPIAPMRDAIIAAMTWTEDGLALFPTEGPMFVMKPDRTIHPLGEIENARFSYATTLEDQSVVIAGSQLFEFREEQDIVSNWNLLDSNSRNQFFGAAPLGCRWAWSGTGIYHYLADGLRDYHPLTQASATNSETRYQGMVSRTGALFRTVGQDGVVRFVRKRVRKYDHRDGIQQVTGICVSSGGDRLIINSQDRNPLVVSQHAVSLLKSSDLGATPPTPNLPRDVVTIAFGADEQPFLFDHLTDGSGDVIETTCPPFRYVDEAWKPLTGVLERGRDCAYHFCTQGRDGETLIGTSEGLVSVRDAQSEFCNYFETDPTSEKRRAVNSVWVGPDGSIWGTEERGSLFCRKGKQLRRFEFDAIESPWATAIERFGGVMYVSTLDGLFYLDTSSQQLKRSPSSRFARTPVVGIKRVDGGYSSESVPANKVAARMCVATRNHGVFLMDMAGNTGPSGALPELDNLMLTNLHVDALNRIWLSAESGTYCYFPSSIRPTLILDDVIDARGTVDLASDLEFEIGQSAIFHISGRDDESVLQFQYRVDGGEWSVFSEGSRTAALEHISLESGAHEIEFRCIDSDVNISDSVRLSYQTIVPLWQTRSFRGAIAGLVIVLVATIIRLLLVARKSRADKARLRQEVLREAREARSIAEEATNEREMLLARVCHDLRNPLTVVQASVDLLHTDDPDLNMITTLLSNSSESMAYLTDQLLMYARSRRGKMTRLESVVPVVEILDRLAAIYSIRVRGTDVVFNTEMADNCPDAIRIDRAMMLEAVGNLVDNAVRHTTKGSVTVRCSTVGKSNFTIEVMDTGDGMAPEVASTVFEPFRMGGTDDEGRSVPPRKSAGLGLYIAKQLVEQMGGTIALDSRLHEGTTISVGFGDIASDASVQRAGKGRRILVLDDDPAILTTSAHLFTTRGFDVMSADDDFEMEKIIAFQPDIAFVDLVMPRHSGFQVARMLREEFGDSLRIIGMSAATSVLRQARRDRLFDSAHQKSEIMNPNFRIQS